MHILSPIHHEKTIFLAFLVLITLGASLSYLSWQNLRQQESALEQHMIFSARAVASGIESGMGWNMGHAHGAAFDRFSARNYLRELLDSQDVLFIGIVGPTGTVLLASDEPGALPVIPKEGFISLRDQSQWYANAQYNGKNIMFYARQTRPLFARRLQERFSPGEGTSPRARPYLILGLDMSEYLAIHQDARRAALWQGGYVLGTAAILWLALLALLKRREQGQRATRLEHFHSQLLDNMPDGLVTLDRARTIISANPAARRIFGDTDQLVGMSWKDIPLTEIVENPVRSKPNVSWCQYALQNRNLEILTVPLQENGKQFEQTLVLVRDRTRIKTLEVSLQEARHMASIGRLAAVVAHDIRNPLSALRGLAQYFAAKMSCREPEQTYARTMVNEADRLNRVVTDLLFLTKQNNSTCQHIALDAFFSELHTLIHMDLQSRGALMEYALAVEYVWADPDLLKQALLNLVLNAVEALPSQNGKIRLSSRIEAEPTTDLNESGNRNGTWIIIKDNGRGLNAEQREKVMEPFYTTRKNGAGLGLAIVHKIMRDHGGRVEIESTPGQGSSFKLYFPEKPSMDRTILIQVQDRNDHA